MYAQRSRGRWHGGYYGYRPGVSVNIGINPYFMKEYMLAARMYTYPGVEKALLLLHHYNLKAVGVGDTGTEDASLLKEMVVKMMT